MLSSAAAAAASSPPPSQSGGDCTSTCSVMNISYLLFGDSPGSGGTDANSTALKRSIVSTPIDGDFKRNVLPNLELLLDGHGVECNLYLPKKHAASSSSKKCNIKSKLNEGAVEFVIRSGGVLKRMRFSWEEVSDIQGGRSHVNIGASSKSKGVPIDETCFAYITISGRDFHLQFDSQPMRDAVVVGFKILVEQRLTKLS
jgi:hypothetical protein